MMMTAMAISPMMRNVLRVATMLPTDVMASDTATIAPTIVPMIRRMSPLCAPGPLAGYSRAGPSRIWRWAPQRPLEQPRSAQCKPPAMLTAGDSSRAGTGNMCSTGKHADELVFTMPSGTVVRLSNWRRAAFQAARARAGLSARFRVHDLRHTAAPLMIQAGYPPKMLQEIMGHASITTTLDLYGHLYPGEMDRYADRLDGATVERPSRLVRPK
jgi:Phage integrase family